MNCSGKKWRGRTFQARFYSDSLRIKCDTCCWKGCLFKPLQFLGRKMRPLVWPGGGKSSGLTEKAWKKPQTVWGRPVLWVMIIFLLSYHPKLQVLIMINLSWWEDSLALFLSRSHNLLLLSPAGRIWLTPRWGTQRSGSNFQPKNYLKLVTYSSSAEWAVRYWAMPQEGCLPCFPPQHHPLHTCCDTELCVTQMTLGGRPAF